MNCLFARLCTIVTLLVLVQNVFGQAFVTDPTFQSLPFKSNSGLIYSMIVQPDNKILLMGNVSYTNDVAISSFPFRLNENGSLDNAFQPSNAGWTGMTLRSDGKIIVNAMYVNTNGENAVKIGILKTNGQLDSTFETTVKCSSIPEGSFVVTKTNKIVIGSLTFQNGSYVGTINRINKDGSLDDTFSIEDLKITSLERIIIQADGKLLVRGHLEYPSGSIKSIVRLNDDGSVDEGFNALVNDITAIAIQQDGKILLGTYGSVTRLNTDGSKDNSFNNALSSVLALAVQPDGKILCSKWIADNTNYILAHYKTIRLNADGTEDSSFISGDGAVDQLVSSLGIQSTGQILVAGFFSKYDNQLSPCIVRLNGIDGHVDQIFNPKLQTKGGIVKIALQQDNKLLVAGSFDVVNDQPRSSLVRLNLNGSIDNTFNIGTGVDKFWSLNYRGIFEVCVQPDKKILIGGSFKSFNGEPASGLIRLNTDGSRDETFMYDVKNEHNVTAVALQSDGNIIIGGFNSGFVNTFIRIKADGSPDASLEAGTGFNGMIKSIVIQPDAKILVAGYFTSYNGVSTNLVVRLNSNGTIDNTFNTTGLKDAITKLVLQPDGKILAINQFINRNSNIVTTTLMRLNSNGTADELFIPSIDPNHYVADFFLHEDGSILLSGYFGGVFPHFKNLTLLNADGSANADFSLLDYGPLFSNVIQIDKKIIVNAENTLVALTSDPVLGIEENTQTAKFYPNPATDVFHLELQSHIKDASVQFFDAQGKAVNTIMKTTDIGYEVDTHSLPRGLYFIRLLSKDSEIHGKIILE